jgi:choline dehydrogenase-like flavoprotein
LLQLKKETHASRKFDREILFTGVNFLDFHSTFLGIITCPIHRPQSILRARLTATADELLSKVTWGGHHMGTTRMHDDPKKGVTDATGRVHGVGNLYVAGSSLFPTSGAANPTLTIIALALRLGDHLAAKATAP